MPRKISAEESGSRCERAAGAMVNEMEANNRVNIPPSDNIQKFLITNITPLNGAQNVGFDFLFQIKRMKIFISMYSSKT